MAKLGPLPTVPSVVKVRYIGLYQGVAWINVFHLGYTGSAPSPANMQAVATAAGTAWNTAIAPLVVSACQLQSTEVTDLSTRDTVPQLVTTAHSGTDAQTGSLSANSVACVISAAPSKRYRGGHPRTYVAGVHMAHISSGHLWDPTWLATARTGATAWFNALSAITAGGSTYAPVCVSYFTHDTNHLPIYKVPPDVYPILSMTVHGRVDSMRTRLGKETT